MTTINSPPRLVLGFKKLLLWTCALLAGAAAFDARAQILSQKWERIDITSGHRGMDYNPATGNLLIAQTSGGIRQVSSADGSDLGNLDNTGISGGIFALSGVTVLPDGTIFACNYVAGAQSTTPLNVYRWADENAVPELVTSLGTLPGAAADRFGEHIKSFATATTTNFLIAGTASIGYLLTYEGTNWTFKQLTVDAQVMRPSGSFIDYNAPGFANRFRFVAKSRGANGRLYNFDPAAASPIILTAAANSPVAMSGQWVFIANGITSHDYDPNTGLLAGTTSTLQAAPFSYTNLIFTTTNGVAAPVELSRVTIEASVADVGVNNATAWGTDGRLYTMIPSGGAGVRAFDISAFLINAPTSVTKLAGQSVTFDTVFGGSALTYEWKKGETILNDDAKYSGATTRSLTINNLTASDDDTYTVTATDANAGTATATITLNLAPSRIWSGGGTDDNWSTGNNWDGTPLATSGETAVFAGTTRLTPVMDGSYDVTGLLFASSAGAFSIGASSGSLTLNGKLENESANLQTLDLPVILDSDQTADLSAPVTISGSLSGSGVLTKTGPATLLLSGTNTHSGNIAITGGTLAVSGGAAISDTATVTLGTGGVLSVDGDEIIGALAGSASGVVLTGKLTIGGAGATYTGGISGTNDIEIATTGTQAINASTTYSGKTILTSGTLSINDSSTFGDGTGALQFSGGTLFRAPQTTAQTFANPVVLTADSTLMGNPASGSRAVQFSSTTLTATNGTLTVTNSAASGTGILSFRINGTTANCNMPIALNQGAFGIVELMFAASATGNQIISGPISGNGRVVKSSAATARQTTLSGSNSFSGGLTLLAGRVNLNHKNAAGTGVITITNATTIQLASSVAGTVITNDIVLTAGANPVMFGDGGSASLELAGVISGEDGASRITRNNTGTGMLILAGDNTFAGGVSIFSRSLTLKHRNALGTGILTIGDPAETATSNPITITSGANLTGANAIPNSVTVNTNFTISAAAANPIEFSADLSLGIAGKGMTKTGAGVLTLSGGNNSYTGPTTVSAGTLRVTGSLWGSPVTVGANGTLGGTGNIGESVAVTGTIAPGNSVGTLNLGNGLDLSAGGTYRWELGALSTNPGDFDQIAVNGGTLVLGGTSKLSVNFTGTATSPHDGDPFWSSPQSWTVITSFSNPGDTAIFSVVNGVYTNGYFSATNSGTDVVLNFTPGAPPVPQIVSFTGVGTGNVTIEFTAAIPGAVYRVLYKDDLNAPAWSTLGTVVGTGTTASIIDTTDPAPAQRFYRVVVE